jgi:hypothetical protein
MTDVLDRVTTPRPEPTSVPSAPPVSRGPFDLSTAGRVLLATLSGAAGVIHLAMVPSHAGLSAVEGVGFAIAGWFQLLVAMVLVTRPIRGLLRLTMVANLTFIAAWVVSRTTGLPFGDHAWHAETAGFVDVSCVAIEGVLILAAGVLLARPGLGRGWDRSRFTLAAVVPIGVVALATGALASPSARDHASQSHGGHAAGAHEAGDGHAGHAPENDKGFSELTNGHQHESGVVELDRATQKQLDTQLAGTQTLVERYPTIADAEAAGYRRAGPFSPGLGTHYINFGQFLGDGVMDADGILKPALIYDGLEPDSPIAGFMYYVMGDQEPEGFIGPNDHWHYHTNTCVVFKDDGGIEAPLGADMGTVTQEQCSKYGGNLLEVTGYMVHVWSVPGYKSEQGTFSEVNPAITCPDGTYYRKTFDELGFSTTMCRGQ